MTEQLMTYDELAEALGKSPEAARQIVKRRRWRRTQGNDGKARISVPVEELQLDQAVDPASTDAVTPRSKPGRSQVDRPDVSEVLTGHIKRLEGDVQALKEERDREKAIRAEAESSRDQAFELHRNLSIEIGALRSSIETEKARASFERERALELKAERDRWADQASRSWWKRLLG